MAAINFPDAPTNGQKFSSGGLTWTYETGVGWLLDAAVAASGGFTFTQDGVPVASAVGQTWFQTSTGDSFVWFNDGSSSQWVEFGGGGSGFTYVSDTAPAPQQIGDTWFDNSTGVTGGSSWVAVDKGTGALVWVQVSPGAAQIQGAFGIIAYGAFPAGSMTLPAATTTTVTSPLSCFTTSGRRYRVHLQIRAALAGSGNTYVRGPILYMDGTPVTTSQPLYYVPTVYTVMAYHWIVTGTNTTRIFDARILPDATTLTIYLEPQIAFFYIEDMGAV